MIKITEKDDKLEIKFDYDPTIVLKVKTIKGRVWNANSKSWSIPKTSIKELLDTFDNTLLDIDPNINVNELLTATEEINSESNQGIFDDVLDTFENNDLKVFSKWGLSILPGYFFEVAASSTGKYHPKYALGNGGLARHTKATIIFANELFANHTIQNFTDIERDCIRASLLLHDGVKHGLEGSKYVTSTHPLEIIQYINEQYDKLYNTVPEEVKNVMDQYWDIISSNIASHMGEWNCDFKTKEEILPKPETEMQKFTHLCDYLASRKVFEVILDKEV